MQKGKDRVIIDTNLWISFLLTRNLSPLDSIISNREIVLVFSQELLDELVEVTQRKKFRRYFDIDDVSDLLLQIRNRSVFVHVTSKIGVCRDPKDDFLLALSIDGKATHLITGDNDLLSIGKYAKTKILTITEYLTDVSSHGI